MEKPADLETKYQKLATEYSKVRSQATVLKKALLEEQAKTNELKDALKSHEQTIRKHGQEMESVTFRNEQLTKRIGVLQQELQISARSKKTKNKTGSETVQSDNSSLLDEELQKKILENAQLVSSMADKDFELSDLKERVCFLERKLDSVHREYVEKNTKLLGEIENLKTATPDFSADKSNATTDELEYWKQQTERWKSECDFLSAKPCSGDQDLSQYYDNQISVLLSATEEAQAEARSYRADNQALYTRLEYLTREKQDLEHNLDKQSEELITTTQNYKSQLDAMTEHLAAQNDKITQQCDEIQVLKHKLTSKK